MSQAVDVLPHQVLWDLAQAVVASRALQVVAEVGVADVLGEDPLTAAELARQCEVDADALERILRLLSAHGVFRYTPVGFAHNEASALLSGRHGSSMRAFARLNGLPAVWEALGALEMAVRRGTSAAEIVWTDGFFGYLATHPDQAAIFGEAMAGKARADIADVLDAYDFSPFRMIADVGGGRGHLLEAVLGRVEQAHGVLFDLPDVVKSVSPTSRMRTHGGDFFSDPLPAADCYLLMEVLHDWGDDDAGAILRNVRRNAEPNARVLVLEHLLPDEGIDRFSATLDVLMLAVTGGRERSGAELGRMLSESGFAHVRVIATRGPMAIVEGTAS